MSPAERDVLKQQAFQTAMAGLVLDTRFREFIDMLREYRERSIDNLTDGKVVESERATCACVGEIAAYKSIIAIYDEFARRGEPETSDS